MAVATGAFGPVVETRFELTVLTAAAQGISGDLMQQAKLAGGHPFRMGDALRIEMFQLKSSTKEQAMGLKGITGFEGDNRV